MYEDSSLMFCNGHPVDQKNWLRRLRIESDIKGVIRIASSMLTVFLVAIGLSLRSLNGGVIITQRTSG